MISVDSSPLNVFFLTMIAASTLETVATDVILIMTMMIIDESANLAEVVDKVRVDLEDNRLGKRGDKDVPDLFLLEMCCKIFEPLSASSTKIKTAFSLKLTTPTSSQFLTASARAILNWLWHCRISGTLSITMRTFFIDTTLEEI